MSNATLVRASLESATELVSALSAAEGLKIYWYLMIKTVYPYARVSPFEWTFRTICHPYLICLITIVSTFFICLSNKEMNGRLNKLYHLNQFNLSIKYKMVLGICTNPSWRQRRRQPAGWHCKRRPSGRTSPRDTDSPLSLFSHLDLNPRLKSLARVNIGSPVKYGLQTSWICVKEYSLEADLHIFDVLVDCNLHSET